MVQLYARCLLTPREYRLYRFYEQDKDYAYMLNFLSIDGLRNQFRLALNDPKWKVVLDNKWLFYLHYQQFGLPVAEVYGIYEPGSGVSRTGEPLGSATDLWRWLQRERPSTLVAKPLGGIMGKRLLILNELHYDGERIRVVTNTGEALDFEDLMTVLDRPPKVKYYMSGGYELNLSGYLVQAKLEQHAVLRRLAPWTTNTVRVVTFLDARQEVEIQCTIARLGRQGNVADNWDRGGISVAVDTATGVMGAGVLKPKYGGQWLEEHPDSGERFTGVQVPYWEEVLELCRRAAAVTPKVRSIGWDVAVTAEGPVLIEGNPDWDLPMVQVHTAGLLQPAMRAKLAQFGLQFPEGRLPGVSVRAWGQRLWENSRERAFERNTFPRRLARSLARGLHLR
jgi:hypothetical protein